MGYGPPQREAVDAGRIATACKRSGGGNWRRVAAAACLSLPLLAAATGPDPGLASLKAATLDLMQAQAKSVGSAGALAVYVGNHDQAMLLDEMRLWIDDAPVRYEYSDLEGQALHRGGLHRLLLTTLTPGTHHFRADFAARYADAPPDHWRAAGILDRTITIDAQPAVIELELVKGSFIGKPDLQFHPLKAAGDGPVVADSFIPGSSNDPQLRFAAFLSATERPLAAADELYKLKAEGVPLSQDFNQQLAQTLEVFGVAPHAALLDQAGIPVGAASPPYADYNRGVALMRDGNAVEGAVVLAAVAGSKGSDPESAALRDKANLVLGYAQLRNHTGANAVSLFSSVRSPGPYSNAALLGLGWALLAPSGNGQNAQPPRQGRADAQGSSQIPFQRIPVMLQPHLTDDIAKLKRHEPYRLKQASPPEEQALRRALVPWVELTGRDPLDPAVQEGMIAIPYALNHIGAYEEANDDFIRAIKLLEAADAQLDIAIRRVNAGQMVQALDTREAANNGWSWWLSAYPREHWWLADDPREPMGAPETFYLQHLMADDGFRASMQDFHDLRLLSDALDHLNGAEALHARVTAATAAQAKLLQELAIAELGREQRHTRMYLGEARFALAHMNEPVDETVKPAPPGKAR
ncbi:MAG: hypothetical protein JWR07_1858 [Nevskia sp.]|nr:hypothetical protein [Nevskia sp.]